MPVQAATISAMLSARDLLAQERARALERGERGLLLRRAASGAAGRVSYWSLAAVS